MINNLLRKLVDNTRHVVKKGAHFLAKALPYVAAAARPVSNVLSHLPGIPGIVGGLMKAGINKADEFVNMLPEGSELREKYKKYTHADIVDLARDATKKVVTHALKGPKKPPDTAVPKQVPKQEPAKISLPTKSLLDTSTPRNDANKLTVAKPTGLGRVATT